MGIHEERYEVLLEIVLMEIVSQSSSDLDAGTNIQKGANDCPSFAPTN